MNLERRSVKRTGWRKTWIGNLWERFWYLFAWSETLTMRAFLVITALFWVAALSLPGDSFTRATFAYMASLAGEHAEMKWLVVFAIYAVAATWRLFSNHDSGQWSLTAIVVNTLGVVLYSSVAFSVAVLPGVPFPAGAAAHASIACAAVWVLVRTNVNSSPGWKHE